MRRFVIATLWIASLVLSLTPAQAHQPVALLATDITPQKGPLLVDGTVSFAIRASFAKPGEKRGFRADFKTGDTFAVQYLIVDKRPENALKSSQLPLLSITTPSGKKIAIAFTERTKFYEPFGRTNYLYLSRYSAPAEAGTYSFLITSRSKAEITIAVGEKEIAGEVIRGERVATPTPQTQSPTPQTQSPTPTPTPTPSTSPAKASPTSSASAQSGYTMAKVRENNSPSRCWTVINGNVYDLTQWISAHPGGSSAIRSLCGIDGTSAYMSQHSGQSRPERNLQGFLLGPLAK